MEHKRKNLPLDNGPQLLRVEKVVDRTHCCHHDGGVKGDESRVSSRSRCGLKKGKE